MLGFPLGLLVANAGEWLIHKHVLHGLGKKKRNFWSFHWHEHHRNARLHDQRDPSYERSLFGWHAQGKEALAVAGLALASTPLLAVSPGFTAAIWFSAWNYHRVHKKAHLDPQWARDHLPWHVDHHVGPNQDANWCVTHPLFDHVMGTRVPYVGTEAEAKAQQRAAARKSVSTPVALSSVPA